MARWSSLQETNGAEGSSPGILGPQIFGGGTINDEIDTDGDEVGDTCMTTQGLSCYTKISYAPCQPKPPKPTTKADGCTNHAGATKPCPPGDPTWGGKPRKFTGGGGGGGGGGGSWNGGDISGVFTPIGGGGGGQLCDCIYCAEVVFVPRDLKVNDGKPQSGRVILSTDPGDDSFPLPYQTEAGKVRITIDFVADPIIWIFSYFYHCEVYTPIPPPDLSQPYWGALLAVNVRVKDPADPSIYAYSPQDDDNLDPDRKHGNLIPLSGYLQYPSSCTKTDPAGNVHQLSLIPQLTGTTPSVFEPGVMAYTYRTELDLQVTDRYAGDNYLVEVSVGAWRCVGTDAQGCCVDFGPAFCGDPVCGAEQQGYNSGGTCTIAPYDCAGYQNVELPPVGWTDLEQS